MALFLEEVDTLTGYLASVRERMIDYGERLLHHDVDDNRYPLILPNLVADMCVAHGFPKDMRDDMYSYTARLAQERIVVRRQEVLNYLLAYAAKWYNNFKVGDDNRARRATALAAVQLALEALQSISIHLSKGGSSGVSGSATAGGSAGLNVLQGRNPSVNLANRQFAPTSSGGASVGVNNSASNSESFSGSVALIVVPFVNLVQRFLDAELGAEGMASGDAIELWRRQAITEDHAKKLVGLTATDWPQAVLSSWLRRRALTPEQVIEWGRRNGVADADVLREMGYVGMWSDNEAARTQELFDAQPAIGEAVALWSRHVLSEDTVKRRDLDQWFDLFWQSPLGKAAHSNGIDREWARRQWRAHWGFNNIGEAQQMLFRCRPGNVPVEQEYTEADYETDLRAAGMNDWQISRIKVTTFRILNYRQVQRLRDSGQLNRFDTERAYASMGYDHDTTIKLANQADIQRDRDLAQQGHGLTIAEVLQLFGTYSINEQEVRDTYKRLHYDDDTADAGIRAVLLRRNAHLRAQQIAAVQRAYVTGLYAVNEANSTLVGMQIDAVEVAQLIAAWTTERMAKRHHDTAAELAGWYVRGTLTAPQYATRLVNLGYSYPDALRVIGHVQATLADHARQQQQIALNHLKQALASQQRLKHAQQLLAQHNAAHAQHVMVSLATAEQHEEFRLKAAKLKEQVDLHLAELKKNPHPAEEIAQLHFLLSTGGAVESLAEQIERATQEVITPLAPTVRRRATPKPRVK